jgi:hypothetical protein
MGYLHLTILFSIIQLGLFLMDCGERVAKLMDSIYKGFTTVSGTTKGQIR